MKPELFISKKNGGDDVMGRQMIKLQKQNSWGHHLCAHADELFGKQHLHRLPREGGLILLKFYFLYSKLDSKLQ